MPAKRECPFCGASMRLSVIETVVQIPGNPKVSTRAVREWICPECDHFEETAEAEEEGV